MRCLAFFTILFVFARAESPCEQIETSSGSYCVCNATYCDTVPDLLELDRGDYQLYTSSKAKLGFWSSQGKLSNESLTTKAQVTIADLSKTRQTIFGFGGAFTDATGINIASLSQGAQDLLLRSYFGSEGIAYSIGRIPIASTDFSLKGYTYCDNKDETLDSFALREEDFKYKLPYVQRAMELRGDINFFASAWSAPLWMKNVNEYGGFTKLQEKYYHLWAEYYLKFFEAYEKHNVTFWGVTAQNEPIDGIIGTNVPNNGFDAEGMKKWIKEALGPAIRNSTYSHLKIILHDDQRIFLPLLKLVVSDKEVVQYADGIGIHFYTDFVTPGIFLNLASAPGKHLFRLATEGCAGSAHKFGIAPAVDLGSWSRGEVYLKSIFSDLTYDVIGWVDWNMALNKSGGPNWINNDVDSPIIVDPEKDEFYKQPMFYAMGHFSKFVIPGSVRLDSVVTSGIKSLSFMRPDKKVVIVLWNKSNEDKSVTVNVDNLSGTFNLSAQSINSILVGL